MKVDFNDEKREFKTLEGVTIRQNRLDVLIAVKAQEITGKQIRDVRTACSILEENNIKFSLLFNEGGKPLTLKVACTEVLNQPEVNDRGQIKEGVEVRYKKSKLMERIFEAKGEIEFESDEIALIKRLLAESNYLNVVLLQAFDWLEGKTK